MKVQKILALLLRYDRWLLWVGIPLLSLVMHYSAWNLSLTGPHVWRQSQTQQTIDSFVEEDFCILNPRQLARGAGDGIARLEFPLYQWLIAALGKLVGNTVLLSRIFTFLLSCVAIWGMHALLLAWLHNRLTALLAAYLMAFAPAFFYYAVTPLPDMLAFTSALWSLAVLLRNIDRFSFKMWSLGMALAAMATLLKLPYAMFLVGPLVAAAIAFRSKRIGIAGLAKAGLIAAMAMLPATAWYLWVMPTWGASGAVGGLFTSDWEWPALWAIIRYHMTEMYPRTLMSIVAVPLLIWGYYQLWVQRNALRAGGKHLVAGSVMLAIMAFSLHEIMIIGTIHDYYLLPIVPFLVLGIALGASHLLEQKHAVSIGITVLLLALIPYMTHRRIQPRWRPENAEFNRDLLLYQTALRQAVPDDALVVAGPDVSHNIFPYYIHKKGWVWDENQDFGALQLQAWRDLGAQYLYCDDRTYDSRPELQAMLSAEIGRFGSIRVYRLR